MKDSSKRGEGEAAREIVIRALQVVLLGEPVRHRIERDQLFKAQPGPNHVEPVAIHQNFRHKRARIVGAGLHRAIGAG